MKKALFISVGLCVFISLVFILPKRFNKESKISDTSESPSQIGQKQKTNIPETVIQESVFVPYWGMSGASNFKGSEEYYYFGVAFDKDGMVLKDEGLDEIKVFSSLMKDDKKSFLVLRLTNQEVNKIILEDKKTQENTINSTIDLLDQNSFSGIILDLEMSGLGFNSTEDAITRYAQEFSKKVKSRDALFYIALFGDTYYRARPYNVKALSGISDKVLIMTYDFHKARGNPGPNFPFEKERKYPYDFKTMIKDFKTDVDVKKIEIVIGMFGYDWKKNSPEMAESYSYNKIKQDFLTECTLQGCRSTLDPDTKEGTITYTDSEDIQHEIWYESPESVELKIRHAESEGINKFSYWAYSFY